MDNDSSGAPKPPRVYRRSILPPLPWRRTESEVIRDLDESLGLMLWSAVRAVRMWIATSSERRMELAQTPTVAMRDRYAFSQIQAPELSAALGTFASLSSTPTVVDAAQLASACAQVATWAESRMLRETALQFAEAAATLEPESATWSLLAARVCRRGGEFERASDWYDRTIRMATGRKNVDAYIRANLGLAALHYHFGRHADAAKRLAAAVERAESRNRRDEAAEAHHDLLFLAYVSGSYYEAEEHVRAALAWYPIGHRRFPILLLDYGHFLSHHALPDLALRLLRATVAVIETPEHQALGLGNMARAAALLGDRILYHEILDRVIQIAATFDEFAPVAYVRLAEGAHVLRQWDDAERFAATALQVARTNRDAVIEQEALALLDMIAVRAEFVKRHPPAGNRAKELVDEMLLRLERWVRERRSSRRRKE
jgi:tetratricopeptide (TPR) repeat protein